MQISKETLIAGLYLLGAYKSDFMPEIYTITKNKINIINVRVHKNIAIYKSKIYLKSQFMELLIKMSKDYNGY